MSPSQRPSDRALRSGNARRRGRVAADPRAAPARDRRRAGRPVDRQPRRRTGITKSGLYAHFGSKEELQLAPCDEASRILDEEVVQVALAAPEGLQRLAAACEAFFQLRRAAGLPRRLLLRRNGDGNGRPPRRVKDRIAAVTTGFTALLGSCAATAIEQHELPAPEDPARLAFELHAILLGADANFVLTDDPAVLNLARQVIRQRLRPDDGSNAGDS